MIEALTNIITSFGLSASAGLNAYIPLLIVALLARFTDLIRLNETFDALTNSWVIALLLVLTLIETLVDKIPAVDTINDGIQTFVRPAAGAILFAASSNVISDIHPALSVICCPRREGDGPARGHRDHRRHRQPAREHSGRHHLRPRLGPRYSGAHRGPRADRYRCPADPPCPAAPQDRVAPVKHPRSLRPNLFSPQTNPFFTSVQQHQRSVRAHSQGCRRSRQRSRMLLRGMFWRGTLWRGRSAPA